MNRGAELSDLRVMPHGKRTMLLWLALTVLFVAFYKAFSTPPGAAKGAPTHSEAEPWLAFLTTWLPLIVIVGAVLVILSVRGRKGRRLNNEAVQLMSRGRYAEALSKLEEARPHMKSQAALHINLGMVNLWLWRPGAALPEFAEARKLKAMPQLHANVAAAQALAEALRGELAAARRHLDETAILKPDPLLRHLAEAVILAREGSFPRALEAVDRPELRSLAGMERGCADALRAWCHERQTGERRTVDPIAVYGETGPDAVKTLWPEFAQFLEANVSSRESS